MGEHRDRQSDHERVADHRRAGRDESRQDGVADEDRHRDDERPEVAPAPLPEAVELRVGEDAGLARRVRPPQSQRGDARVADDRRGQHRPHHGDPDVHPGDRARERVHARRHPDRRGRESRARSAGRPCGPAPPSDLPQRHLSFVGVAVQTTFVPAKHWPTPPTSISMVVVTAPPTSALAMLANFPMTFAV